MITIVTFRDHEYDLLDRREFELLRSRVTNASLYEKACLAMEIMGLLTETDLWFFHALRKPIELGDIYPGKIIGFTEPPFMGVEAQKLWEAQYLNKPEEK